MWIFEAIVKLLEAAVVLGISATAGTLVFGWLWLKKGQKWAGWACLATLVVAAGIFVLL